MNPLKLRLAEPGASENTLEVPRPAEIQAWLAGLQDQGARKTGPALQGLLRGINTRDVPVVQRLQTLILLEPKTHEVVTALRGQYRNHPLPFNDKVRPAAALALQLVGELAVGYKLVVNEGICNAEDDSLNHNMFLVALRQAIAGLGQQLLESYIQYLPPPAGHWGELHRLYDFADRNGLSTQAITPVFNDPRTFTTIQQAYLRVAMLGLTQPNHLLTGQAEVIYGYLERWTVGCRLERRKDTLATPGDMFVDLASDNPPLIATGHIRFRPVDGRYVDITYLQTRLREMRNQLEASTDESVPPLEERMRRDMLARLCNAWEGRGERTTQRNTDGRTPVLTCIGLGTAHHFISDEADYLPEQAEIAHLKPWRKQGSEGKTSGLRLRNQDEEAFAQLENNPQTRVSRFELENDVWATMHNRDLNAREQRKAAVANFHIEGWKRINHSHGGLALSRTTPGRSQLQVGSLTAFRDDNTTERWRIGVIRWLQNNAADGFDIGIKALANSGEPVAVRAIAGAGNGGEYFRSLHIVRADMTQPHAGVEAALIVPAHIYDIRTQLVLNRADGLEFVKLTQLLETTSTFSLFAYKHLDLSMADYQQRIKLQAGRA